MRPWTLSRMLQYLGCPASASNLLPGGIRKSSILEKTLSLTCHNNRIISPSATVSLLDADSYGYEVLKID